MLAMGLTLGLALALLRKRPGAYGPSGEFSPVVDFH
jgi:cell division protein FtsW